MGSYCPEASALPILCEPGTFSDSLGNALCSPCPAQYFCLRNSTTYTHQVCPSGYYCKQGTRHAFEFPCPKGTYNPVEKREVETDCVPCPPGKYCEGLL